ncbi:MAG: DUF3825 domain-containing protein [Gammaproteobacteria bacterium]|nr:DUF3825 domain-containing protein [Gammaproteobacteria bacterium]
MRIFEFAKVADWDARLTTLANLAEPERWNYLYVPDQSPLPVLDSYLRYTFMRIHEQSKVAETERLACFNTGLLTPGQEEIFGVFRVSDNYDPNQPQTNQNKKWFLTAWARSGDRLLTEFMQLPELASYWTEPGELIFNPMLQVQLNLDHIIRDNLNRFPEELGGCLDRNGIPTDLQATPDIEEEAGGETTGEPSPEPAAIPLATRNALEGAMKHSIRLAQRSYRIAIPQFHHKRIQLLLPLYLRSSTRPDLALTLEKHGEWYRAATVLYPDWAYRHARLLARPNSEWLGGFRADLQPDG